MLSTLVLSTLSTLTCHCHCHHIVVVVVYDELENESSSLCFSVFPALANDDMVFLATFLVLSSLLHVVCSGVVCVSVVHVCYRRFDLYKNTKKINNRNTNAVSVIMTVI